MATLKGAKSAKKKSAPQKAAPKAEAAAPEKKDPPPQDPAEVEIIQRSQALVSVEVTETGIVIAENISIMPALRIQASLIPYRNKVMDLVAMAERAVINDKSTFARGIQYLSLVKNLKDELEAFRVANKKPIDDYARFIQNLFMPLINDLESKCKQIVGSKMLTFQKAEEEVARKKAEEERLAREEEARKLAEQQRASGNEEGAQAIENAVAAAPAPVAQSAISHMRVGGNRAQVAKSWQGTVEKPMVVLQAIIDGKVPMNVIDWRQAGLNEFARTLKTKGEFHGISVDEKETLGVR